MSESRILSLVEKDAQQQPNQEKKSVFSHDDDYPGIDPDRKVEWLVCGQNDWGEKQWFVRITVAGLHTRRYGPFCSWSLTTGFYRRALDRFTTVLVETLTSETISQRVVGCIVEDEMSESLAKTAVSITCPSPTASTRIG